MKNATDYLKQQGIPFPPGAFANYVSSGSKLIVRNTQGALDLVDTLVESDVGVKPTQVEIESKFIEISQNNVNELGFDWLLGPFSIGGGVYGDGGTPGGDSTANYNNFPFGQIGGNPVTAGNRSGIGTSVNSAITANSLDALVAGIPQGANVASPGIFGLAGVFTNPQFQLVIRALSQQKGVDLMSAPKVTTKSGNSATIKIIREFPVAGIMIMEEGGAFKLRAVLLPPPLHLDSKSGTLASCSRYRLKLVLIIIQSIFLCDQRLLNSMGL